MTDRQKKSTRQAPAKAAAAKGTKKMATTAEKTAETVKKTTEEATERAKALFGDMNERAKAAMEKGTEMAREMGEFNKGNVEAIVASAKIAAEGTGELAREAGEYGRQRFETATSIMKDIAGAKSPTEVFQIQSEFAKGAFDAMVEEGSKMSEAWLKLAGDAFEPISNRYAIAAEKMKAMAA